MKVISKVDESRFDKGKIYEHFLEVTVSYSIRRGKAGGGFLRVKLTEYNNSNDALKNVPAEHKKYLHHIRYKVYARVYYVIDGNGDELGMTYDEFNRAFKRIDRHRSKVIKELIK